MDTCNKGERTQRKSHGKITDESEQDEVKMVTEKAVTQDVREGRGEMFFLNTRALTCRRPVGPMQVDEKHLPKSENVS